MTHVLQFKFQMRVKQVSTQSQLSKQPQKRVKGMASSSQQKVGLKEEL